MTIPPLVYVTLLPIHVQRGALRAAYDVTGARVGMRFEPTAPGEVRFIVVRWRTPRTGA